MAVHKRFVVVVLLVALLAVMIPVTISATPYDGKIVTDVRIEGAPGDITQPLLPLLRLQEGMQLAGDIVDKDVEMLTQCGYFYRVTPRYMENAAGVSVIYDVMPNITVKNIVFKGVTVYTPAQLMPIIGVQPGMILNNRELQQGIQAVLKKYNDDGYVLAKGTDVSVDMDGTLTVAFSEGIVESINISGNDKTKEYVISREIRLQAGKPFNKNLYIRSYQNLNNLGFFSEVNFTFPPGHLPNQIEVNIKVKEGSTGQFNIGGGYATGSNAGFFGSVGIGDTNLFGTGDSVSLQYALGGSGMNNKSITYTRPYLTEKGMSLSVSLYDNWSTNTDYGLVNPNQQPVTGWNPLNPSARYPWSSSNLYSQTRSSYNTREMGTYLTFGQKYGDYERYYLTLKTRNFSYEGNASGTIDYRNPYVTIGSGSSSVNLPNPYYGFVDQNFGTLNSLVLSRIYDSRDNVFGATSGQYQMLSAEVTGSILGGNFNYQKLNAEYRTYFSTLWDQVLAMKMSAGVGGNCFGGGFGAGVPEVGGYYLGGPDNLRGYNAGQFTGASMLYGTLEYRIPVIEKIQAVAFTDIGQSWATSRIYNPAYGPVSGIDSGGWRADYGLGLRVITPIGALKFDWGLPYSSSDFAAFGGTHFYFSMGGNW